KTKLPFGRGEHGGEKANRRAAVADEKVGLLGRDMTAATGDANRALGGVVFDLEPERLKAADHDLRVVAIERTAQRRRPPGQRGANQRAIRDAFRAGGTNLTDDRAGDGRNLDAFQRNYFLDRDCELKRSREL